jgi:AraC-like DNA-binding protein
MDVAAWMSQIPVAPDLVEALFDCLPDVIFFTKDRQGRYILVNQTWLERCGRAHKREIRGRTAAEIYPGALSVSYAAQDRVVFETGVAIRDKLELTLYPGGGQGWCVTVKMPIRDPQGAVVGLAGLSRDLHAPDERHPEYRRLAQAVEIVQTRYREPLKLEAVSRQVGLSMDRFERLMRQVLHLSPRQLLIKTRIEVASRLLAEGQLPAAQIGLSCGYSDHSAFTRQFRATVGLTPTEFRAGMKLRRE